MDTNFIKKSGLIISKIARDFLLLEIGENTITISDYVESFHVSRGLVQNAIHFLEQNDAVHIEKNGKLGSKLISKNNQILLEYTNWKIITASMPIPFNKYLASLSGAISEELNSGSIPFVFAYITSSLNRLYYLCEGVYDFIVVSKSTAAEVLKNHPEIEIALELDKSIYSAKFSMFFRRGIAPILVDGLKVAIDNRSTDQCTFTKLACKNNCVNYVEIPYTDIGNALNSGIVDMACYRMENFLEEIQQVSLPFSDDTATIPVILTKKSNYRIKEYLQKSISCSRLEELQINALKQSFYPKFY